MTLLRTVLLLLAQRVGSALLSTPATARSGAASAVSPRSCILAYEEGEEDTVVKDASDKMKKSLSSCVETLATLRVGRATPDMLDRVQVNYYDMPTPLNTLASISVPTPSQLVVDVYDKSCLGDVERALLESDLGMTPSNDGSVIRLNVPMLTAERRKELAKTASKLGEDGKVALRNIRRDAIDKIKKFEKDGLSQDGSRASQEAVNGAMKKVEKQVEEAVSAREKEITTV